MRLEQLWKAPVRLETLEEGQPRRMRCERGEVVTEEPTKSPEKSESTP
jgi:hypothetical protein